MYVILAIVIIVVGMIMIFNPRLFFDMTEGWKSRGGSEPSDWYIFLTRGGGIVFLAVGTVGLAVLLLL